MNSLSTLPIRYFADLNPGTGYNNAARGYVRAFAKLGIGRSKLRLIPAIQADLSAADVDVADPLESYMRGDWEGDESRDRINIVHLPPTKVGAWHTSINGRYNVAVTAWETDRLPAEAVEQLKKFDEIWVPGAHNKAIFDRAFVGSAVPPVFAIPHVLLGFAHKFRGPGQQGTTEFYTMGTWNARKDLARLVRAYFATGWRVTDPVNLQLYCVPPTREPAQMKIHAHMAEQQLRGLRDQSRSPNEVPGYGLHPTYVPYEQVVGRHVSGDVFVSASHGEGFCLPAIEAIACGNWVIGGGPWLDDIEARLDLGDDSPIEHLPTRKVPITPMPEVAGYELEQQWWEIDQATLAEEMRAAHETRMENGPATNALAAERAQEMFSAEAIAKLIAPRLEHWNDVLAGSGW